MIARAAARVTAEVVATKRGACGHSLSAALALAGCVVLAGCSEKPAAESPMQGTALADIATVAAEDVTDFADLPGIEGFAELSPALQAAVVARANTVRCDCGCPGHSVNACLHQEESCDVAHGLARGFVADAQTLALHAPDATGEVAGPTGEVADPTGEVADPTGEGVSQPGDSGPAPAPSGDPGQAPAGASAPDAPAPSGR